MNKRFIVRITHRAGRQIKVADAWWRENRSAAPNAVRDELVRVFKLLSIQPGIGSQARNVRLRGVRRIHLSRIRYYLYYRFNESAVEVLAFWHTSRGSEPEV